MAMLTSTNVFGCVAIVMTHVAVGIQFETDVLEKHMKVVAKHAPTRLGTQPNGSLGETCEMCPVGECNRQVWGDISTPCKVYDNLYFNCHYSASKGTCPPTPQRTQADCYDSQYRDDPVDGQPWKMYRINKESPCKKFNQYLASHTKCDSSSAIAVSQQTCEEKAVDEQKPYYSWSPKPNQGKHYTKGLCTVHTTCSEPTYQTGWKWHIYTSFPNMDGDKCNSEFSGRTKPVIPNFETAVCGKTPGGGVIRTFTPDTTPEHIIDNLAQCQHLCETEDSVICKAVVYRESTKICTLLDRKIESDDGTITVVPASDDAVSSDRIEAGATSLAS